MLPPYELHNKPFKTAIKGYNTTEVDEHIDFVIEKYTELYRAYNELERRFSASEAELDQFRKNEDAIRRALVNAQNAGNRIVKEADDRSALILQSTKEKCSSILTDFQKKVEEQQDLLAVLQNQVSEFRARMFTLYQQHIEFLDKMIPDAGDDGQWNLSPGEYTTKVIGQVALDVEAAAKARPAEGQFDAPKVEIDDSVLDGLMNAEKHDANEVTDDEVTKDVPISSVNDQKVSLELAEGSTTVFGVPNVKK